MFKVKVGDYVKIRPERDLYESDAPFAGRCGIVRRVDHDKCNPYIIDVDMSGLDPGVVEDLKSYHDNFARGGFFFDDDEFDLLEPLEALALADQLGEIT